MRSLVLAPRARSKTAGILIHIRRTEVVCPHLSNDLSTLAALSYHGSRGTMNHWRQLCDGIAEHIDGLLNAKCTRISDALPVFCITV